jgi:Deoxyhypusine synthase
MAPTYIGSFQLKGKDLRLKGQNRIGNMIVPNNNYCSFEEFMMPLLDEMLQEQQQEGINWTPSKIIARLGERINNPDSVYYWCATPEPKCMIGAQGISASPKDLLLVILISCSGCPDVLDASQCVNCLPCLCMHAQPMHASTCEEDWLLSSEPIPESHTVTTGKCCAQVLEERYPCILPCNHRWLYWRHDVLSCRSESWAALRHHRRHQRHEQ